MAVRVPPMGETVNHKMHVMTALAAGVISARPVSAQGTVRCTSDSYGTMTTTRCSDGTRSTAERYGSMTTVRDNTGRRATLDTYGGTTTGRITTPVRPRSSSSSQYVNPYAPKPLRP